MIKIKYKQREHQLKYLQREAMDVAGDLQQLHHIMCAKNDFDDLPIRLSLTLLANRLRDAAKEAEIYENICAHVL